MPSRRVTGPVLRRTAARPRTPCPGHQGVPMEPWGRARADTEGLRAAEGTVGCPHGAESGSSPHGDPGNPGPTAARGLQTPRSSLSPLALICSFQPPRRALDKMLRDNFMKIHAVRDRVLA